MRRYKGCCVNCAKGLPISQCLFLRDRCKLLEAAAHDA